MLRKGMFLADRYEIIDQIGTGGMSDVYKAKCHKLNRFVAIKVLKSEFSEDKNFVAKFRIEAQSAAGLTHPNVVNVYDVGDENGIYYIVMELVEGITLKRYIEKKGKLSSKEAVSIAIQVAQGIEAAHSHHIVHRDIKPQNIIISKEGKVKVTDFGIARAATTQTINSSAMGSVHYISPEQARGGYSDEKSDIYSFGITLYEMLTGTVPFDGDTTVAVAVQHIQDEIAPPSQVTEDIPISVDKIVMKCTQKKTERRYQSATELIADLKKSLVMPDVDFVKILPVYASKPIETQASELKTDLIASLNDQEDEDENIDDLLLDDELIDDNDDEDETTEYDSAEEDYDDIEDVGNEKLDKVVKWIGIGIVAIIAIISIFVAVKLIGSLNKKENVIDNTKPSQTSSVEESTFADDGEMVTMIDVKGMTEEEAKDALYAIGLGYKATKQPSDTVERGKVISQSQKVGSKVKKNTTITLSISEGSATITIPNVKGETEEKATSTLKAAGFKVSVDYDYNDSVEQGNVIRQTPNSNSSAKAGDTVTIVVSQGKKTSMVKVPDLMGCTENEANQKLSAAGLEVGVVKYEHSSTVTAGKVMSQDYSVNTSVAEGTKIGYVISKGPESTKIEVPGVVGETEAEAKKLLEAAGFKVAVITEVSDSKEGTVIEQSHMQAEAGTTITIKIAKKAD